MLAVVRPENELLDNAVACCSYRPIKRAAAYDDDETKNRSDDQEDYSAGGGPHLL